MDSAGLYVIVAAHKQANEAGKHLRIARPPENIYRVFELTGLVGRLEFTDA